MKYPVFLEPGNTDGWLLSAKNIIGNYFSVVEESSELEELANTYTREGISYLVPGCFCYVVKEQILYTYKNENGTFKWVPYGSNLIQSKRSIKEIIKNQQVYKEGDDLNGSFWMFNQEIDETAEGFSGAYVTFVSGGTFKNGIIEKGTEFDAIRHKQDGGIIWFDHIEFHKKSLDGWKDSDWIEITTDNHLLEDYWKSDNYRVINITEECTDPTFFKWLNANAFLISSASKTYIEIQTRENNEETPILVEAAKRDELGRILHYTYITEEDAAARLLKVKKTLEEQIETNKSRLNSQDSALTEHVSSIGDVSDRIAAIEQLLSISGSEQSAAEIQERMSLIEESFSGILDSVGETVANFEDTIEDHREDIDRALSYKTQIDNNTAEINTLKQQMSLVTLQPDDIAELVTATNNATTKVNDFETDLTSLKSRVSTNESNISTNANNISSLSTSLNNKEAAIYERINSERSAYRSADNELSNRITQNTNDISSNYSKIQSNTSKIDTLTSRLDNILDVIPNYEELEEVENRINTFYTNSSSSLQSINNAKSQVDNTIADFRDEIQDIRAFDSRISTNEENIQQNTNNITSLQQRMGAAENTLNAHARTLNSHNDSITANTESIRQLRTDVDRLGLTRQQLDAIGDYSSTVINLQNQITRNKDNISSLTRQQNTNTNDIYVLQSNVSTLSDTLNQTKAKTDDLENQFLALNLTRADVDNINRSIDTLNTNVASAQSLLSGHTNAISSNSSRINDIQSNLTSLLSRMTTAENGISKNRTDIGKQAIEISTIKSRLNTYQKKLTPGENVTIEKDNETGDTVISVDLSALAQSDEMQQALNEIQQNLDNKLEITDIVETNNEIAYPQDEQLRLNTIETLLGGNKIQIVNAATDIISGQETLYFIKSTNEWRFVQ